jgi:hypothetical protein
MDRHCWLYTAWIRADLSPVGGKGARLPDRVGVNAKRPLQQQGQTQEHSKDVQCRGPST